MITGVANPIGVTAASNGDILIGCNKDKQLLVSARLLVPPPFFVRAVCLPQWLPRREEALICTSIFLLPFSMLPPFQVRRWRPAPASGKNDGILADPHALDASSSSAGGAARGAPPPPGRDASPPQGVLGKFVLDYRTASSGGHAAGIAVRDESEQRPHDGTQPRI